MSLYDDDDVVKADTSVVAAGWSQGVNKFTPTPKCLGAASKPATPIGPAMPQMGPFTPHNALGQQQSQASGPGTPSLPPVINLNAKKGSKDDAKAKFSYAAVGDKYRDKSLLPLNDPNWNVVNEYDPLWPNDYHKVVQEIRETEKRDRSPEESKKRRYSEATRERTRDRYSSSGTSNLPGGAGTPAASSGFGRKPDLGGDYSDEENDKKFSRRGGSDRGGDQRQRPGNAQGAAIAPPPSLNEDTRTEPESPQGGGGSLTQKLGSTLANPGLGVAAKIMAKYGYKHGQGLGKTEQGMSQALAVEKTSKRGGRILHEKDFIPPPPVGAAAFGEASSTPPHTGGMPPPAVPAPGGSSEYGDPVPSPVPGTGEASEDGKVSITDLMRNPGKVVLCKNMVGPGEVDAELEPEVKEECNGKYGDVQKVVIFELPNAVPEEAVRIFIEFKRVESAIKAVVDLNGRFFGGRQVQARFYDPFKFSKLELHDD